ncbi:hypothetical protein EVJ58_g5341 [Rhodofomes roseus]|uniref:Uncharacterized protein n=1 Tax=Rhodofomes roseus TaxID=34475 RepID=A0A4Y9YF96_9APHY|nr:hypothetical protein EVJ58_g5341 [Rhodofomes roseus]
MLRTMSMDPPTGYRPRALSRDVSMDAASVAMTPSRTPFQVRSRASMTPQQSGQVFGPSVLRRDRETSEPPPIETLGSKPVFVKAPPQSQSQQMLAMEPTLTLGSLAEAQPRTRRMSPFGDVSQSRSSLGQSSSMLMSRSGSLDGGRSRVENPAQKALEDLDVYKTPLLPTRLRGSPGIPDMFKTKKMPIPVLMAGEHDKKKRLGSAEKEEPGAKPYAGKGGMKKLLMRRKQEEREERENDQESAMEDEQDEGPSKVTQQKAPESRDVPHLSRLTVPEFPPAPEAGRPSSLRVGRNKITRSHAPSAQLGKNRFSAFDEEDADDAMLTSEDGHGQTEAPKPPSLFQAPAGFSFSKDTAPIKLDASTSKEPPIASLPFSFSKPSSDSLQASTAGAPSVPQVPKDVGQHPNVPPSGLSQVPTSAAGPAPAATTTAPAMPVLQLTPPTPGPSATPAQASSTVSAGEKAGAEKAPRRDTQLLCELGDALEAGAPDHAACGYVALCTAAPTATSEAKSAEQKEAPKSSPFGFGFGAASTDAGARTAGSATGLLPSPFGATELPSGTASTSAQKASSEASVPSTSGVAAPTSIFGAAPAKSAEQPGSSGTSFIFGAPAKAVQQPSALFGSAPPKPAEPASTTAAAASTTTTSSAFGFGAPAKPAEKPATSTPFNFGAPAKSAEASMPSLLGPPANIEKPAVLTFGQPKEQQAKAPEATSTPALERPNPSPFGGSSTSFGGFGGTASTSTEPAKSSFPFGQPTAASQPAATPAVQAPKPLFGGSSGSFSFGAPPQTSAAPAEPAAPAKSPFSFGSERHVLCSAAVDDIRWSTSGSHGADVSSKPFAFGVAAAAPARPTTPPRVEQEVNMDESPVRGAGMEMNGHGGAKEPLKLTTGFSFGSTSGSSPFGQSAQAPSSGPFAFGGSSGGPGIFGGAKTENKQETKPSSGFGFGQPSGSGFFGQKPADVPAPSASPGAFGGSNGFGQSSAPPSASAPFGFGPSTSGGSTGGFGQAGATSTTPSPSTFGSSAPFSFGVTPTSTTAPSNPFGFGSQPASPATANPGLPSSSGTSSHFQFGQPAQAPAPSPASPFGGTSALPPGGAVFNVGAASAPAPAGARPVKRLPTRRGGKR